MEQPTKVGTQVLLALIGMKEVELHILREQLAEAQAVLKFQADMQSAAVPVKEKQ